MNGYNFTERVRQVLMHAREEALALRHEYVSTEHMLLGLGRDPDGVAGAVLLNTGIDADEVRSMVMALVKRGPADPGGSRPMGFVRAVTDSLGLTTDAPGTEPIRSMERPGSITVVVERGDGSVEAMKFGTTREAMVYLARMAS